ncbi:MAG: phage tail assembly protein [Proteobacteria bacterium]|nr:phage tail assembly protein [Pseudomonadota bacterium]
MAEYILKRPIKVIDQTITKITFREPTGEDLIGLPIPMEDPVGWGLKLADRIADNVPQGTVLKLPMFDALPLTKVMDEFLDPSQPAGSSTHTSSVPAGGTTPASSV